MKIMMNSKMEALFNNASITLEQTPSRVKNKELNILLDTGIQERDGVYLLKDLTPSNKSRSDYYDLTDMECTINHIHITDFLSPYPAPKPDAVDCLRESIRYVKDLQQRLSADFPEIPFRIILSVEWENPKSCVIRFHRIRDNEPSSLNTDDLDGYLEEGILYIDI